MRKILATLTLCVACSGAAFGQSSPPAERTANGRYEPPGKAYTVAIPVLPELGGKITETEYVVTFQDAFTLHASIACFPMDATQRWENETRGRRDYLIWFFNSFVESDFEARFPGTRVESAKFLPTVQDGALLIYNLLPGGTMFADRAAIGSMDAPPVAKRGNLLFVRNRCIYVLSVELAEKVIQRRTYTKTVDEEDALLESRLTDLLSKMEFAPAATP